MSLPTSLRDKRNIFGPTHYSIANYCTQTNSDMKATFAEDYFLNNLHLIPDTLKENLANTISDDKMPMKPEWGSNFDMKIESTDQRTDYSPLAGITNFFSGVMNVISAAMFSKPKQTDLSSENGGKMALEGAWQSAKSDDQNKILQDEKHPNGGQSGVSVAEMGECKAAAVHCQNKLEQVRLLLSKPVPCTGRVRRRPKKVFVESNSVEDCFEDAFAPEDFERLPSSVYLECVSPKCYQDDIFHEIAGPKVKSVIEPIEPTDIIKNVSEPESEPPKVADSPVIDKKDELVASCEDKLFKLKALLQNRRKKVNTDQTPDISVQEPSKQTHVVNKHYKNPNCCNDKRRKSKMKQSIQQDLLFANEINYDELSSVENSPSTNNECFLPKTPDTDYFDEISGRFHSTSISDSEDFQIVFNDIPRRRRPSDCDSEDSIEIIFKNSPDSCYTSNDCYTNNEVFGHCSDSDSCDSDSELSDSGCDNTTFKLSHSLSKSVSNLTDDSLYASGGEDEVDSVMVDLRICETVAADVVNNGLLIDNQKKENRKNLPTKRVTFSTQPDQVRVMRVWDFASRQARPGPWERYARDRERFKRRIENLDMALSWVLKPQHRSRVMFQRFMPWWNAQKRKELAEKKQKEEKDRREAEVRELERVRQKFVEQTTLELETEMETERQQLHDKEQSTEGVVREELERDSEDREKERTEELRTLEETVTQTLLQPNKTEDNAAVSLILKESQVVREHLVEDQGTAKEKRDKGAVVGEEKQVEKELKRVGGVCQQELFDSRNDSSNNIGDKNELGTKEINEVTSKGNIDVKDFKSTKFGSNKLECENVGINPNHNGLGLDKNISENNENDKNVSETPIDNKKVLINKDINEQNVKNEKFNDLKKVNKINKIFPVNDKILDFNCDFNRARAVEDT